MIDESYVQSLSSQLSDALRTIERLDAELKTLQIQRGQDSFLGFNTFQVSPKEAPAPRAPFSVYYIDSSWKMYFPAGSFTYAGFAPSTVTPAVSSEYVPITWISSGNGAVYAHVQASVADDGSVSACDSISFDDTAANPAAGENKKTVTFKVAVVTDYLVDQVSLGAVHIGYSGGGQGRTGTESVFGALKYDESDHQIKLRMDTKDLSTGQITEGNWEMIVGGQAVALSSEA